MHRTCRSGERGRQVEPGQQPRRPDIRTGDSLTHVASFRRMSARVSEQEDRAAGRTGGRPLANATPTARHDSSLLLEYVGNTCGTLALRAWSADLRFRTSDDVSGTLLERLDRATT